MICVFCLCLSVSAGVGNDGILDIRLAVSRDNGRTIAYPPARDARRPFITQGINRCALNVSWLATSPPGLSWCPRAASVHNPAQMTAFDTSTMCTRSRSLAGFLTSKKLRAQTW